MQAAQLLFSGTPRPHLFTHFPYTTLFRSVAISYLVRRLEEGSSQENFMSAVFELDDPAVFEREAERFRASLAQLEHQADVVPQPRRQQNRQTENFAAPSPTAFANTPDTDPNLEQNRAWARDIIQRMQGSRSEERRVAK